MWEAITLETLGGFCSLQEFNRTDLTIRGDCLNVIVRDIGERTGYHELGQMFVTYALQNLNSTGVYYFELVDIVNNMLESFQVETSIGLEEMLRRTISRVREVMAGLLNERLLDSFVGVDQLEEVPFNIMTVLSNVHYDEIGNIRIEMSYLERRV